jgi:hypothetical protein
MTTNPGGSASTSCQGMAALSEGVSGHSRSRASASYSGDRLPLVRVPGGIGGRRCSQGTFLDFAVSGADCKRAYCLAERSFIEYEFHQIDRHIISAYQFSFLHAVNQATLQSLWSRRLNSRNGFSFSVHRFMHGEIGKISVRAPMCPKRDLAVRLTELQVIHDQAGLWRPIDVEARLRP